jgi:hypothetical protein
VTKASASNSSPKCFRTSPRKAAAIVLSGPVGRPGRGCARCSYELGALDSHRDQRLHSLIGVELLTRLATDRPPRFYRSEKLSPSSPRRYHSAHVPVNSSRVNPASLSLSSWTRRGDCGSLAFCIASRIRNCNSLRAIAQSR